MKKTIFLLSGLIVFILLAAAIPYFDVVGFPPVVDWLIGAALIFVLPVLLIALLVISIRQIFRKPPPAADVLDLEDFQRRQEKEAEAQKLANDDQYV